MNSMYSAILSRNDYSSVLPTKKELNNRHKWPTQQRSLPPRPPPQGPAHVDRLHSPGSLSTLLSCPTWAVSPELGAVLGPRAPGQS